MEVKRAGQIVLFEVPETGFSSTKLRSVLVLGRLLRKRFENHVFHHVYVNARYQYIQSIKEQASFVITGLIIIEMALNIHGHLCYELLQNILFRNDQSAFLIIFLIFLLVKLTEIGVELWYNRETDRYENTKV